MSEQACMGGWCATRASCGHYHAKDRTEPAENLCRDWAHSQWVPVRTLGRMEPTPKEIEREEA